MFRRRAADADSDRLKHVPFFTNLGKWSERLHCKGAQVSEKNIKGRFFC